MLDSSILPIRVADIISRSTQEGIASGTFPKDVIAASAAKVVIASSTAKDILTFSTANIVICG